MMNNTNTKIVLYGAISRHNFGDLLFAHIIGNLFEQNGYQSEDIIYADIIANDMRYCGGHNIIDITTLFDTEYKINIIHIGGDTLFCDLDLALKMLLGNNINIDLIKKYKILGNFPYILSKKNFKNPGIFIANSVGGSCVPPKINTKEIISKIEELDLISVRDIFTHENLVKLTKKNILLSPDCAILTQNLLGNAIKNYGENSIKASQMQYFLNSNQYIAFQLNSSFIKNLKENDLFDKFIDIIHKIIEYTKLPIILFCAGVAYNHDNIFDYYEIASHNKLKGHVYCFDDIHIFGITYLISKASLVIGTSLHVGIISFTYTRPRITIHNFGKNHDIRDKQNGFFKTWNSGVDNNIIHWEKLYDTVKYIFNENYKNTNNMRVIEKYEEFFRENIMQKFMIKN